LGVRVKSHFTIRSLLVAIAIVGCLLAIWVWPEHRFVYSRYFENFRFGIEIGGEIDLDGTKHRTLNTSYYDPPQLMYGVGSFRIPDDRDPKFHTIYDEKNGLFCVYDVNGWGYIAIVNTKTHKMFSSIPMPYYTSDTVDWRNEYEMLKSVNPELPYAEIFENALKRQRENAG